MEASSQKHPLQNSWTIWFDSKKTQVTSDWFQNLQQVAVFDTVEDFWCTFHHIKRPNDLEFGSNYHVFRTGVKPMWEDDYNTKGGKWVMTIPQTAKDDLNRLDDLWELLLLSMIGEYLDDSEGDQICGAVLSKRKAGPRISVWTRDRDDRESLKRIGTRLRASLKLSPNTALDYQSHADSINSGSSYQNQATLSC
eukprot:NODE_7545_length_766_cov_32.813375_g6933_i0.p1 GENE.NODE_7545_length_766_cov_32.813375_g6933_i0~~NODE_7545_length_766_cov_32.813375_g6933_i0.p1  ORF type:complete len:195 (-),score=19.15 NODE_7545_length_766_cov_32.813375_g6933_i0:132-716(-)